MAFLAKGPRAVFRGDKLQARLKINPASHPPTLSMYFQSLEKDGTFRHAKVGVIVQLLDLMLITIHVALFMAALLTCSNWYLRIWDLVLP